MSQPILGNRQVLALPEFRKLFVAQAVSDVGDGMTLTALLLEVNQLTHSPAAIAVLTIAVAVPTMAISLLGGAVADRVNRRSVMVASDSLRALLVLGFVYASSVDRLPLLVAIAAAQATIGTLFGPARGALIPRAVPPNGLVAANSLGQISRTVGTVTGTSLVGLLVAATGTVSPAFVVDAATFVVSVLIVLRVDRSLGRVMAPSETEGDAGLRASIVGGLALVRRSRTLTAVIGGAGVLMLGIGVVNVLFVPLVVNVLHETPAWFGPLEAAQTSGMIIAATAAPKITSRVRPAGLLVAGSAGLGLMTVALGITPSAVWLLPNVFATGLFLAPTQAALATIIQSDVIDEARGRVFGALQAVAATAQILASAAAGVIASTLGPPIVLIGGGVIVLTGAGLIGLALLPSRRDAQLGPRESVTTSRLDAG